MWHEARRSERKVHDMMDAARKRAQRRAVFLAKRRGDPQQSIQVIGNRCRTYRDDGLYQATQDQQGLYVLLLLSLNRILFSFFKLYNHGFHFDNFLWRIQLIFLSLLILLENSLYPATDIWNFHSNLILRCFSISFEGVILCLYC